MFTKYQYKDEDKDNKDMKEILEEYGTTVLAAAETAAFWILAGKMIFSDQGLISNMISLWGFDILR